MHNKMQIIIRCAPKDERKAIEFAETIVEKELLPKLIENDFHPTKYAIKTKTNKGKFKSTKSAYLK